MDEAIDICGNYRGQIIEFGSPHRIPATVTISLREEVYDVQMVIGGGFRFGTNIPDLYRLGTGIRYGNLLSVAFPGGSDYHARLYTFQIQKRDDQPRLVGRWVDCSIDLQYLSMSRISRLTLDFDSPLAPSSAQEEGHSEPGAEVQPDIWSLPIPKPLAQRIRAFHTDAPPPPSPSAPTTDCRIDIKRLGGLAKCMDTCGMEDEDESDSEWPWNILSTNTVVYSCGMIARKGASVVHNHDSQELALCAGLAGEACGIARRGKLKYGGEETPYRPFFITASHGAEAPVRVTGKWIRTLFGGTIYPKAKPIEIIPLAENGKLRDRLNGILEASHADERASLMGWRAVIQWFAVQPELHASSFIRIGDDGVMADDDRNPSYYPILLVGITRKGSLVGICNAINQA